MTDKRLDVQVRLEWLQEETGDLKDLCEQLMKKTCGFRKWQKNLSLTSADCDVWLLLSHH